MTVLQEGTHCSWNRQAFFSKLCNWPVTARGHLPCSLRSLSPITLAALLYSPEAFISPSSGLSLPAIIPLYSQFQRHPDIGERQKAFLWRPCSRSFKPMVLCRSSQSGYLFHCLDFWLHHGYMCTCLSSVPVHRVSVFVILGWRPCSVTWHSNTS